MSLYRDKVSGTSGGDFIVYLDASGSFPCTNEKQYMVHANDTISIILDTSKIQENTPLLLTNFPTPSKKKTGGCGLNHPPAPEFAAKSITETLLHKNYKVFEGTYNEEGSWQVDLHIEDFDGSLFLQVIFLAGKYTPKRAENLTVTSYGTAEWIVIQPRISANGKAIGMD